MAATASSRKSAGKAATKAADTESAEIEAGAVKVSNALKLGELVERVATATGAKKKDIKATIEATLAELGKALEAGEQLNLPPFGKARVAKPGDAATGQPMVLKLKRGGATRNKKEPKEALADVGEAG